MVGSGAVTGLGLKTISIFRSEDLNSHFHYKMFRIGMMSLQRETLSNMLDYKVSNIEAEFFILVSDRYIGIPFILFVY